nr:hypothetical protein KPHV_37420 [Kitasatospora purpeofusca]
MSQVILHEIFSHPTAPGAPCTADLRRFRPERIGRRAAMGASDHEPGGRTDRRTVRSGRSAPPDARRTRPATQ